MTEQIGVNVLEELEAKFGPPLAIQATQDHIPTLWVPKDQIKAYLRYLKQEAPRPYPFLYDLTAIDERERTHREGQPESRFTVVYHLVSYERNSDVRIKVPLVEESPSQPSITDIWPMANWYEREIWDMFGVRFEGHPNLRRILMPQSWPGYPLRKDHYARATEMESVLTEEYLIRSERDEMTFHPEEWGLQKAKEEEIMFLNLGPQHPGTHGILRVVLALDGEELVDLIPMIGYHHRGAEKMGERQSWHTYIPYTDRVDYLSGFVNELPYVMAVEQLAGIQIPDRARVIRVMLTELFRIISHLVWLGTYAQDLGAMSPVFYAFTDRERAFRIIEAVTGARMHPGWFRIGGVAADLPKGWEGLISDFLDYLPHQLDEYDKIILQNRIFKARTVGIGTIGTQQAIEWGISGPNLRATGFQWDWRKKRPYSGYDQFDFEIPIAAHGDCYDRAWVRIAEMRQSLRIVRQAMNNMPAGSYMSDHPLATPPLKRYTMHDIETLIDHFLNVTWGPVIPEGESTVMTEGSKGFYSYYLVSDHNTISYRTRIRTPSFAHMQALPVLARGLMIPDLLSILGSLDYVLADIDR